MSSATLAQLQHAAAKMQSGDAAAALAVCERILSFEPKEPEALHLRALALARLGRFDDAAAAFEAAARAHPRKDAILVNYGNAMKAAGRLDAAEDAYARAVAFAPQSAPAWNALGLVRRQRGDFAGAEAAFESAIRAQPAHAGALNNLGALRMALGRDEDALIALNEAVAISPDAPLARINRGAALRRAGRLEEAIADHAKASEISPGLAESHYQLGASLASAGDFAAAAESFRRALAIDPRRADAHRDLARTQWEIGAKAEAFEALDRAAERLGAPELFILRGELSYLSGDPQAADDAARRALRKAPDNPPALGLLARVLQAQGDCVSAVACARRASELAPHDFALRHSCVEIELANGFFEEANARLAGEAPLEHRQKHLALRALAQRALGDERYRRLYDYDRFTAQIAVEPPEGYSSIADFNAALRAAIEPLHKSRNAPLDQTLYGGTQSVGRLWREANPVIQAYVRAMLAAAQEYVRRLPDDSEHPFLARKSAGLACAGAWSVMLSSGGGHVDHIHPAGWISACYYVQAPEEVLAGAKEGFLRLGASGVRGLELPPERWVRPEPGTVVFFPSFMWHGVERFEARQARVTAPFDLVPV